MDDFVKERDAAFIHFVKTDDLSKVKAYCKKYDVPIPKSKLVLMAGVYKAVIAITSIPEDIKTMAMQKCLKPGFNQIIKPSGEYLAVDRAGVGLVIAEPRDKFNQIYFDIVDGVESQKIMNLLN